MPTATILRTAEDGSVREFWSFGGELRPKGGNIGKITPAAARELTDVDPRIVDRMLDDNPRALYAI